MGEVTTRKEVYETEENVLNETKETEKREETEINEGFGGVESKSFPFAWRQRQSVSSLGTLRKTPPSSNNAPCW